MQRTAPAPSSSPGNAGACVCVLARMIEDVLVEALAGTLLAGLAWFGTAGLLALLGLALVSSTITGSPRAQAPFPVVITGGLWFPIVLVLVIAPIAMLPAPAMDLLGYVVGSGLLPSSSREAMLRAALSGIPGTLLSTAFFGLSAMLGVTLLAMLSTRESSMENTGLVLIAMGIAALCGIAACTIVNFAARPIIYFVLRAPRNTRARSRTTAKAGPDTGGKSRF